MERELVINEKDRKVFGHHQVMTIHITNSFTDSSSICSVTRKQYEASCPAEEVRDLQVALALVSSCLFSAAVGLARARKPQGSLRVFSELRFQ